MTTWSSVDLGDGVVAYKLTSENARKILTVFGSRGCTA